MLQLNGANGEATGKDDVKAVDYVQDKRIKALEKALNAMRMQKKPKSRPNGHKPRKGKVVKSSGARLHRGLSHMLRSDHTQPTVGLMDAIPTATVVQAGSISNVVNAGEQFLWMGFGDHHNEQVMSTTAYPSSTAAFRAVTGRSYNGTAANMALQTWSTNSTTVNPVTQWAQCPYGVTASYRSKVNKMSVHLSYSGTATNMTAEFRIYIDYHGDLFENLTGTTTPDLAATYNAVYNHARSIKVKVRSEESIDYVLPITTAQLAGSTVFDTSTATAAWPGAVGSVFRCQANKLALADQRSYFGNNTFLLNTGKYYSVVSTPLIYIVGNMAAGASVAVHCTVDAEFYDENLRSVSTASVCDSLTATALHTIAMNAHSEASGTPLHHKGLKFKDIVRRAVKAEHVAQSVASSPLGSAILTAALAA